MSRAASVPAAAMNGSPSLHQMSKAIVLEGIWKVPALRFAALRGRF